MRVAIVHDYLTQRGGAERVALAMLRCFPEAPIYTMIYNPVSTFEEFAGYDVRTTYLSRVPPLRADARRALPFLPWVARSLHVEDVDVVLASTSGWAHGITSEAPIVAYCHTPARWLHESDDYFTALPGVVRRGFRVIEPVLRRWDRDASGRVAIYLANSSVVARRIRRAYNRASFLLPPPATLEPSGPQERVPGLEPGFLLTIGRNRGYKNIDRICDAVVGHTTERLVVVGHLPSGPARESDRVTEVRDATDAQMRWLYAHCDAVVAMSREDFGLTPVEGFRFGKPTVALAAGGYLDSCTSPEVAVLVDDLAGPTIAAGLARLRSTAWEAERIEAHGERFSPAAFEAGLRDHLDAAVERTRAVRRPSVQPREQVQQGRG